MARRQQTTALLCITVLTVAAAPLFAGQQRPMTVDDVLQAKSVGDVAISPDARWVAYVVTQRDLDSNVNNSDVWIVPAAGGDPVQLTHGLNADQSPQWARDGSWLAFRSDRSGSMQVFGIDPNGGEAWPVTKWKTSVGSFQLSPDGRQIALLANDEQSAADEELEKLRGRPTVWDSSYADEWTRLWVAPLEDRRAGEATQSSPDSLFIQGVVWSPDSRALAWSARPSPVLRTFGASAVFVQDEAGAPPRRVTSMAGRVMPVAWTDEIGLIVAGSGQALGTYNSQLWKVLPSGGDPVSLTSGLDENAGFVAATSRNLLVEAGYQTGRRLYRIPLRDGVASGSPEPVTDDAMYYSRFSASEDGSRVAFLAEGPQTPPDVHVSSSARVTANRLTTIQPEFDDLMFGEQAPVQWKSRSGGESIEGVLTLPVGYREGRRVPLLLVIHGGPSGVSTNRFNIGRAYPIQVFAGMGYAVLQPNYRGSTGYGERFRGLNRGHISGRDWIDVNSGVDALIERGIADPERLGIMGWSFGGHHTYWGITQTDRFAAASAGAGANDLISMYAQTDLPEFYHTYLGPKPWEDFDLYEERSAYRFVERVTTPLLIQVGERDERVPAEQSIQFYEAIKSIGRAPVKLVVYPGQPHGIRDPRLTRDLITRNVEWFKRWIPPEREISQGRN